ncbi:hypothetical protein DSCO28_40510 [Desulfosarcina ovata subsp. sediminis]|uniref:Uncharacterized protein n=1 Tax=Desulfosarcina ovata subsp. sediminis TaxID=885957 RepID=A0A5K7ZTF5_9BACT|nr:hypothetical protein [Desulfosarcina ovata]BBO83485.1 hypothetical protein DSCO28_40510 [Desulfosarcina ovata subsp. sediminis]
MARRVGRKVRLAAWLVTGKVIHTRQGKSMQFLTFEVEIVTARNSGNTDSNQIAFTLLNEDENVTTVKSFRYSIGDAIEEGFYSA